MKKVLESLLLVLMVVCIAVAGFGLVSLITADRSDTYATMGSVIMLNVSLIVFIVVGLLRRWVRSTAWSGIKPVELLLMSMMAACLGVMAYGFIGLVSAGREKAHLQGMDSVIVLDAGFIAFIVFGLCLRWLSCKRSKKQ